MTYQLPLKTILKLLLFVLLTFAVYNLTRIPRTYHFEEQTRDRSLDGQRDSIWGQTP
jgi:hypothetical protein